MTYVKALVCVAVLLVAAGCGPPEQSGEIWYRVSAPGGGPPAKERLTSIQTEFDTRLLEAGLERRDVFAVPPDRIRVVLPESVVPRIPEFRRILEQGADLGVELTYLPPR